MRSSVVERLDVRRRRQKIGIIKDRAVHGYSRVPFMMCKVASLRRFMQLHLGEMLR